MSSWYRDYQGRAPGSQIPWDHLYHCKTATIDLLIRNENQAKVRMSESLGPLQGVQLDGAQSGKMTARKAFDPRTMLLSLTSLRSSLFRFLLAGEARAKGKSCELIFLSPLSPSPRATPACLKGNGKDCYAGYSLTFCRAVPQLTNCQEFWDKRAQKGTPTALYYCGQQVRSHRGIGGIFLRSEKGKKIKKTLDAHSQFWEAAFLWFIKDIGHWTTNWTAAQ